MKLARAFEAFLRSDKRYCVLYGGSGAGKSEHAARKLILRSLQEGGHNWLIVRKYAVTLRDSVMETVKSALAEEGLPYIEKKQLRKIWLYNNSFNFYGVDDPEKLKSIKGITGVWIEEASELTEKDFLQIDLRLRGETKHYKQIILTFNPTKQAKWVRDMFVDKQRDDTYVLKVTANENPFLDDEYRRVLQNIPDEEYRKVYLLGEWQEGDTQIFGNYEVVDAVGEYDYYGLDFGFNNPTALVGVKEREDGWHVDELLYRRGMTQEEVREAVLEIVPKGKHVYCDAAEPARIEDLKRAGVNAIAADKRVTEGILYLKTRKLYISGVDLLKEIQKYSWQTKRGQKLDSPVKVDDHLVDAMRYAIFSHYMANIGGVVTKSNVKAIKSIIMRTAGV